VISIKIDRTFVDQDGTRWIIDYKTSRHEEEDVDAFLNSNIFFEVWVVGEIGNTEASLTKDFLDLIPKDFMSGLERISVYFTGHGFTLLTL